MDTSGSRNMAVGLFLPIRYWGVTGRSVVRAEVPTLSPLMWTDIVNDMAQSDVSRQLGRGGWVGWGGVAVICLFSVWES